MRTARYVVALLVLLSYPWGVVLWLFIHPLARFWRRLGVAATYMILSVPIVLLLVGVYRARHTLLAREFGTNPLTIGASVVLVACAATIAWKRHRLLTPRVLVGVPELSDRHYPGRLLTEGIYARIRHPRYVEVVLWVSAYAFFANYLAPYVVVLASIPVLMLVVVLEERELRERFGTAYDEYCRRVPRFVPRSDHRHRSS